MAETETEISTTDQSAQAASAPQVAGRALNKQSFGFRTNQDDNISIAKGVSQVVTASVEAPQQPEAETAPVTATDPAADQLKALLKSLNIDFDGDTEALKEKFKPHAEAPTEEEKKAAQAAEEKAMLDLYIESGGDIDTFSNIKYLTTAPIEELSKSAAIKELTDAGFTKEEAETELAHRYYIQAAQELNDLDKDNFESDEDYEAEKARLQKRVDFGAKKLANKSAHIRKEAEQFFNKLKDGIKAKELQKQQEAQYSANVAEHFSKLPREITLELGERNGQKLAPVQFKVSDAEITPAQEILKDPAKRQQFFFNQDGTLNIDNASKLLIAYFSQQRIAKVSLQEGEHRNTQTWRSQFPATTPYQVGIGGAQQKSGDKGQVAARGQASRVPVQKIQR